MSNTDRWVSSKALASWLDRRRDNDVKVVIGRYRVAIVGHYYDRRRDELLLELDDGYELQLALHRVLNDLVWCPATRGARGPDEMPCCVRPEDHLPL